MTPMDDVTRWSTLPEGQFFERKSAYDRSGPTPKWRKASDIAWNIVETLSAMANADGGELVVGMEDDGTVTGIPHAEDKVGLFLRAAGDRNYVDPPLRFQAQQVRTRDGVLLLHFTVDWSPEVHRLSDGRYLRRVNDANMPFPAEQIAALKQTKAQGIVERSFPPGATLDDLDLDLVASLLPRMQVDGSPQAFLHKRRLVEDYHGRLIPCLAALLLFGKDPLRWHPRCGIDFVRWEGTQRKHGADLNVVKRIRIEYPLSILLEKAYDAIWPFIRERQQLEGLFFKERLEYPTFVWQEALVNAVAHRDYSIYGASVEVWMFDDHMEIRSPGPPPSPVTAAELNRRKHVHMARNPTIVHTLADLGYMRELGEGIPRMFDEMEREGFYPPYFDDIGGVCLQVILRNQPIYDPATRQWLKQFENLGLSIDQKRLLAYAHGHGNRFTSRDYQKLVGLDIYAASNSIKDMIRKGVVRSTGKGRRVYQLLDPMKAFAEMPNELTLLLSVFQKKQEITNDDIQKTLGVSRPTATRVANDLCQRGWLERLGTKRWTRYRLAQHRMHQSPNASDAHEVDS